VSLAGVIKQRLVLNLKDLQGSEERASKGSIGKMAIS
jgi:hypothetical protein